MVRRILIALTGGALLAAMSGCVVKETKPLPKINAVQAQKQIPADELLDVSIRTFDTGVPTTEDLKKKEDELAKKRIYPEIREGESRYMATQLRSTLEQSGQWGAVRVVPTNAEFVDVLVTGKILESTGAHLALEVSVKDSTGRQWIKDHRYESDADLGSYKTDASMKARDPFQNVYSQIANDMVAYREKLVANDRRDIRRVTELRFAQDLAPQAMDGYLAKDEKSGFIKVARLPADNDPIATRIDKIRERDAGVVDTVNGYYANFADQMQESYGNWRRTSFDEIEKEERLRNQARTRTFLGAAAVLASVFVPGQCRSTDYNCRRIESAARTAGVIGGTASVLSGLKKYSDARVQAQALKELSQSFQSEVAPQVVDVEGRTLRLTGTAEEQYREWRELLQQLYTEDNGGNISAGGTALPAGVVPATAPPVEAAAVAPGGAAAPATTGKAAGATAPANASAPASAASSKAKPSAPASAPTNATPSKNIAPVQSGSASAPASKSAPSSTTPSPATSPAPASKVAPGTEAIPASKAVPVSTAPTTSLISFSYLVRPAA
jgi:hypothetical protein